MEFNTLENQNSTCPQRREEFKWLTQKICALFATEGVRCQAYRPGAPHFSNLPQAKQDEVLEYLRFYLELCMGQIAAGDRLSDNLSFTWRALKRLGFVPRSDLFNHLTDEDVIEIYNSDNRQLFRNLRFFDHCSYTLEELCTLEWWTLFERDQKITMKLFEAAEKIFRGEITETIIPTDIEPHIIKETQSLECNSVLYQVRCASPLYINRRPEGLICILKINLH